MGFDVFIYNANYVHENSWTYDGIEYELAKGFNFGNRLISRAIQKLFDIPNENLVNSGEVIAHQDYAILNVQDHVRAELMQHLRSFCESLNADKTIIVSIGSNMFNNRPNLDLDEKVASFLSRVSAHSKIGVRGLFTKTIFESLNINNAQINGCPTFWTFGLDSEKIYSRSKMLEECYDSDAMNILIGGDVLPPEGHRFSFLCQGDYDRDQSLTCLKHNVLSKTSYGFHGQNIPFMFDHWPTLKKAENIFLPIEPTEELFKHLSDFDLYIGSRIHGCITALNAGVPSVNTNYDFRALEMCYALGIPHISQFPGFAINHTWLKTLSRQCGLLQRNYEKQKTKMLKSMRDTLEIS